MKITETKPTRLADFLARAGYGGKREAARLIAAGRVKVNGEIVTTAALEIVPAKDHVRVDEKLIKSLWPPLYIMMNKPEKTLCAAFDPGGRRTVYDLLGKYGKVVQSIGRLDYDTEGLLLFTNDGDLAHALTSPDSKVTKLYRARIKGQITRPELDRLRRGVDIGGYITASARVHIISSGPANMWLEFTLTEGKYRQIKRMVEAVGHRVLKLIRDQFGPLEVGNLKLGDWRHLEEWEIRQLRKLVRE